MEYTWTPLNNHQPNKYGTRLQVLHRLRSITWKNYRSIFSLSLSLALVRFILWKRKEENRNVSRRVSSRNDSALRFQRACLVSDKRARGSRTKVCPDKISLIAPVWPRTVHVHVRFSFAFPDLVATFPIFLLFLSLARFITIIRRRHVSLSFSPFLFVYINKNLGVVETTSNINN